TFLARRATRRGLPVRAESPDRNPEKRHDGSVQERELYRQITHRANKARERAAETLRLPGARDRKEQDAAVKKRDGSDGRVDLGSTSPGGVQPRERERHGGAKGYRSRQKRWSTSA